MVQGAYTECFENIKCHHVTARLILTARISTVNMSISIAFLKCLKMMNHLIHFTPPEHEGEKGVAHRPHSEQEMGVLGAEVRASAGTRGVDTAAS